MDLSPASFGGPASPLGERALTVSLRDIAVRFEGLSDSVHQAACEKYSLFLSSAPPIHTVTVCRGEPAYLPPSADDYIRLEERTFDEGRIFASTDFAAWRPSPAGRGILKLSEPEKAARAVGGMENYLRWTLADLTLQGGAFILHSSGVVREGRAYVFFGHSGAGKSTVAGLSEGCQILSDDLVLLSRDGERWMASTTPFWGTFPQQAKDKGTYPLEGLYRLVQAGVAEIRPLSTGLAVGMLVACCPFVTNAAVRRERLMPLVEDCCRKVGARILKFRKDPSFWEVIALEERHAR